MRKSIGKGRKWTTTTNIVGWPDLAPCWNPRQPGRILAIEIKVATKLEPAQERCLTDLRAGGWETYVVTQADVDELARTLRPSVSRPG